MQLTWLSRTVLDLNNQYLIKLEPPCFGILHKVFRIVSNGSLPFLNEMFFYNTNNDVYQSVVTYPEKKIIIMNKLESTEFSLQELSQKMILEVISQVSTRRIHNSFSPLQQTLFKLLNSPVCRSIRELFFARGISLDIKFAITFIIMRLVVSKRVPSHEPVLIHNDLALHNILFVDKNPYVIDFEDSIPEKKWIFVDVTDLALSLDQACTRQELRDLIIQHSKQIKRSIDESSLSMHIIFGFLRYNIRVSTMKRKSSKQRKESVKALRDFLSEKKFFQV